MRSYRVSSFFCISILTVLLSVYTQAENGVTVEDKIAQANSLSVPYPLTSNTPLIPGMTVARKMGPVVFEISISKTMAQVDVSATLGKVKITGLTMTIENPARTFKIADGKHQVSGSLGAFFCAPPVDSHLLADFCVNPIISSTDNSEKTDFKNYRGDLVVWESPVRRILKEVSVFIIPEVEARVLIMDNSTSGTNMSAQLTFYYGDQVISSYISMATTTVIKMDFVSVGNIEIKEGGTIHFRPATRLQTGELYLNVSVSTIYPAETYLYNGAIADWPWINGRADNCGG